MRVLIAAERDPFNPYIDYLKQSYLSVGIHVVLGVDYLFTCNEQFDIIHIHWPEALFKWVFSPTEFEIEKVLSTIVERKTNSRIKSLSNV